MVVVPTLLTSVDAVAALLEHLEVLALGNLDPHIHFAILSDFTDARRARTCPTTRRSSPRRATGIEALNQRFGAGHADRFFLFHRERRWNAREQAWMGWERKRGKIEEFNRLLRGATRHQLHRRRSASWRSCRRCATASRSTPTRGCRATPRRR